jgi:archaellum biogenesis protein FlaJ (TadC family)
MRLEKINNTNKSNFQPLKNGINLLTLGILIVFTCMQGGSNFNPIAHFKQCGTYDYINIMALALIYIIISAIVFKIVRVE